MNEPNPKTIDQHRRGSIISQCERNGDRRLWVRKYPPNTRLIRGYISRKSLFDLQVAGNRVVHEGGHYVFNATGQQRLEGW